MDGWVIVMMSVRSNSSWRLERRNRHNTTTPPTDTDSDACGALVDDRFQVKRGERKNRMID